MTEIIFNSKSLINFIAPRIDNKFLLVTEDATVKTFDPVTGELINEYSYADTKYYSLIKNHHLLYTNKDNIKGIDLVDLRTMEREELEGSCLGLFYTDLNHLVILDSDRKGVTMINLE